MRIATIVIAAYLLCVIVAAFWRLLPFETVRAAVPDLGALTAAYLGLTARRNVAPSVGGSVALGYLVDLISGAPPGLCALALGFTCLVARAVQQRILVRGAAMTIGFSAFVALLDGTLSIVIRAFAGVPRAAFALELQHVALATVATALLGPLVWRVFRRIDAAFARTHRERDAALEGLAPGREGPGAAEGADPAGLGRRPGAARAAPPASLGRAGRRGRVPPARRPAVAAPGDARRGLLRAHGLERGQGALPVVGTRQDPRQERRAARRQPARVQHLRHAQA